MVSIAIYISISLLIGSISCMFGKKLYMPILMLTVFSTVVTVSFSIFDLNWKTGIITAAAGIAAAWIARLSYRLGVFLLGCILGGVLSMFAVALLPAGAARYGWILILVLPAAAGFCAVKWCSFFIIASTSFNGAFMIAVPICFLFAEFNDLHKFIYADGMLSTMANLNQYLNSRFPLEHSVAVFALTAVIAIGGIVFQTVSGRE